MFHSKNGLFFEGLSDGSVRIRKTYDERDIRADNVVMDVTLSDAAWASVVCSVSEVGETNERWKSALEFHNNKGPVIHD